MKGLPLLRATTPISASVEDAAAIQVHYTVIIHFVPLNHVTVFFLFPLYLVCPDKKTQKEVPC